jgi:hypothetical protein
MAFTSSANPVVAPLPHPSQCIILRTLPSLPLLRNNRRLPPHPTLHAGISSQQLPPGALKFLTRLHYCAPDSDTYGDDAPWGEHEIDYILVAQVGMVGGRSELDERRNSGIAVSAEYALEARNMHMCTFRPAVVAPQLLHSAVSQQQGRCPSAVPCELMWCCMLCVTDPRSMYASCQHVQRCPVCVSCWAG